MLEISEFIDKVYGKDNPIKTVDFLRDAMQVIDARVEARNENRTLNDLFEYAMKKITEAKNWEIAKTVVSTENGYFIDELGNGKFQVSKNEFKLSVFDTMNEAVNFLINKI
jgi:hypothetical protein